jgi:hypothetical protein
MLELRTVPVVCLMIGWISMNKKFLTLMLSPGISFALNAVRSCVCVLEYLTELYS